MVIKARCQSLRKLSSLLNLLDAGLRDMLSAWMKGDLQSDGWEQEEVQQLILSLFQDSEFRRDALDQLQAS
jgi:hypothetical protein